LGVKQGRGKRAVAVTLTNLRLLVALLSFAASLAADAQPTAKVYRIGYLSTGSASTTYTRPLEAFRQGLHELGWVEDRNVYIEYRFAEGRVDRLPALADELVRLKVDIIVASPTPSALAARNATRTIPIVGMSLTEPVAVGLVASLARPGGNVTGLTYGVDTEIFGKQLQLLKEVIPNVRRVAVLSNPGSSPAQPLVLERVRSAARSLGLPLQMLEVREPNDFEPAFGAMVKEHADALLLSGDPIFFVHRKRLAALALKSRLPSMSTQWQWVDAGGLLSYGPSLPDQWGRAATYVDKILRGAKPSDLPIEQPAKFELVINLRTARELGITMPKSMLQRADEVIQ
jgi:putative tryptophan/tyrosine transport system substrate-binding protein